MDETATTRATVRSYVERAEARDWDGFGELLADDVVYEMPQTRERVRGREGLLRFNQEYPGDWHLRVRRVVADDGLITRITDFWPDPYEPPPNREHLVERW